MPDDEEARRYITAHLGKMTAEDICALFLVRLDQAAEMTETYGQEEKEHMMACVGKILSSMFRGSDIVSRVGEDSFLVYSAGAISGKKAQEKAKEVCSQVRLAGAAPSGMTATVSVGVYLAQGAQIPFERLFGQAAAAIYEARSNGTGSVCVLTDEKDETEGPSRPADADAAGGIPMRTLLEYLDGGVGLVEMGPQLRVIYASRGLYEMIGADKDTLRIPCELKDLGVHPDYEADYERALRTGVTREGITDHIHRISRDGKHWIWRHVRAGRIAYPGEKYPVMMVLSTDISDLIRVEQELRESNERLRVAFRQTPHVLWEVDVPARTFNIYNVDELRCQQDTVLEDFPRCFLEHRVIHPDSAEDFRIFADRIMQGEHAGSGNFIMRDMVSGSYGWVSMSYRMTYDEEGKPQKAVGIHSKLPGLSGIGSSFMKRRPLPETLRRHLLMRMKVNLTKDAVEEIWLDGTDQTAWTWGRKYSQIIELEKKNFFIQTDAEKFGDRFSREKLFRQYEGGEIWSSEIYKRVDKGGNIGWMKDVVNLVKDPETGDITMYACCCDYQPVRDRERLVDGDVRKDPHSGLYTIHTVKKIAEALLAGERQGSCALALLRTAGEEIAASYWRFISIAVSMALGVDCVTGQYRPGIILAFIPHAGSKFDVKRRIEDVFAYLRISMADIPVMENLRFIAGAVTSQASEADYDTMLMRAGFLSDQGKDVAIDTVIFPSDDEDWTWTSLHREAPEHEVALPEHEEERALTKEEQTVAFHCVTDMLSARSTEDSLLDALRNLGRFYDASRAYILNLEPDRQTLDMTYEWNTAGKQSIRHVVQGVKVGRIPLLRNCLQEKKPALLKSPITDIRADGRREWNYIAYPLKQEGEIAGFLCVEDAKRRESEVALLGMLAPYISGEERRFRALAEHSATAGQDALTRLPNLSSYMDVIYSLDSDTYSSMGVLSLDVPNYSVINSSYGFEYGKKMLIYLANTLQNVFGKSYIFRTWDAEFVVLFPNTIQEVFTGRCTRLRAMIQRRYPRQVRIGYVWAEGIFAARNMVKEAQAIMRSESVKEPPSGRNEFLEENVHAAGITQKTFVPYYQPKVDMRTGEVVGAEALARRISEDGTIISPGQFIGAMEENGSIRELDLFMLEMVLRQLSEWKRQGYMALKVSINISRVTLFNPSALASVLAIQSRYPEIPVSQIELEITETGGSMEKATLAEVIEEFRQCGIGFELDDFGSGWANISLFSNVHFQTVKLDRSLTSDFPSNEISSMMVENITQICRNFDMRCIAEGVETKEQAEALMKAGCVYGQGFYYAKPLPAHEFEKRYFTEETKEEDIAI